MPQIKKNTRQIGEWSWNDELFWRKIVKGAESECWQWRGSTGPHGALFGANKVKGTELKPQMTQARRILYQSYFNTALTQPVWHRCYNSNCMNPLHLTLDNTEIDLTLKRRQRDLAYFDSLAKRHD